MATPGTEVLFYKQYCIECDPLSLCRGIPDFSVRRSDHVACYVTAVLYCSNWLCEFSSAYRPIPTRTPFPFYFFSSNDSLYSEYSIPRILRRVPSPPTFHSLTKLSIRAIKRATLDLLFVLLYHGLVRRDDRYKQEYQYPLYFISRVLCACVSASYLLDYPFWHLLFFFPLFFF